MKFFLLSTLFFAVVGNATPRVQYECSIWNAKGQVPNKFKIYEDSALKKSFIKFGNTKMIPAEQSAEANTVRYDNYYAKVSLINKGGTAGRWDGDVRFSNGGRYYDTNDTVYDVFCEIK